MPFDPDQLRTTHRLRDSGGAAVVRPFGAVVSSATTTDLIAAVPGKRFKLLYVQVIPLSGTGTWRLQDNDGTPAKVLPPSGTTGFTYDLTGATGPNGYQLHETQFGMVETPTANKKLQVVSTGTGSFSIVGRYARID